MENRYKQIREDFEMTENGWRLTTKELANIFISKGYHSLTENAIRKIETDKRNVSIYELQGYCEVFNTTSDYLLGFTNTSSTNEDTKMVSSATGLSDKSLSELKHYSKFQHVFIDKLISSKALLEIIDSYIYRNSYFFHKIEIIDEFVGKTVLSNDENSQYHHYRSEQLLKNAFNILDNDMELFSLLNKSHSNEMWQKAIDWNINIKGLDAVFSDIKQQKDTIPKEIIDYVYALKEKGSDNQ